MSSLSGDYTFFKNKRGEDAEQVSKDFFTYPLIVNVFSVIFISLFDITNHEEFSDIIIFLIVTFILYLIMHFVSRRSLKLTRQLVLKYVLIVAAFSVFNIVARQTEFFGINRYVRDPYEYERINITYNDYINGDKTHQVVISMNHITKEEEALLSQLEDLQKMASQQFKAGKYWYDNPDFPSGNNIWIDVGYVTSISDGYNDAYMHYVFAEDDVKFFTDNELFVEISYDEEIK